MSKQHLFFIWLIFCLLIGSVATAQNIPEREMRQAIDRAWTKATPKAEQRPRADQALQEAARENSEALAEMPERSEEENAAYVRFLLEKRQVRDAGVSAIACRSTESERCLSQFRDFIMRDRPAPRATHFGLGFAAAKPGFVATLLVTRRRVEITKVLASLDTPLEICGILLGGQKPQVLITTPDGKTWQRPPRLQKNKFCATLPVANQAGKYQAEVMLEGQFGPEVAALFPLYIGVEPPKQPIQKIHPPSAVRGVAPPQELLVLLNKSRKDSHAPPLSLDNQLTVAARRHSVDMRDNDFFGHRSPTQGELDKRLEKISVTYQRAGEALALAGTIPSAHEGLLASPGHRRTLLDPAFTHVGIGLATDEKRNLIYVTVILTRR